MADTIKIGSFEVSSFKVGSDDCKVYLGDTLLYSGGTPPTPTYEWVSYGAEDTVPSTTIYGVKLEVGGSNDGEIDFGDSFNGIAFICENGEWTALNIETGEEIDISSYYDEVTYKYTILFSDLGYNNGLSISYPQEGDTFVISIELYQEYQPTLQWVTLSQGDTILEGNIYGVRVNSQDVGRSNELEIGSDSDNCGWFGGGAPTRAPQFTGYFYTIKNGVSIFEDSWDSGLKEFIFSDYNGAEYYYEDGTKTAPYEMQIYVYV